jgi:hypothetical protein
VLLIDESWHYGSAVKWQKASLTAHKAERYAFIRNSKILSYIFGLSFKKLKFIKKPNSKMKYKKDYMDYARGVSELVNAIESNSLPTLGANFSLHVNEAALAIHYASTHNGHYVMTTKLS